MKYRSKLDGNAVIWYSFYFCKTFIDNDASSKFEVLVQAAEEIKGKGTIGYINCG